MKTSSIFKGIVLAIENKSISIVCDKLKKTKNGEDDMKKTQNHLQLPNVVSRDEWLVARKELLAKEKELFAECRTSPTPNGRD